EPEAVESENIESGHAEPEPVKAEYLGEDLTSDDSFTPEELQLLSDQVPELDVKTGLLYCAESKMFYIEMLMEFSDGKKDEELAEFLQKEDWNNYRITVHALKSNAKNVGAMELSEEARMQEMAAKEKRTADVSTNHPALAEHYKDLQGRIHAAMKLILRRS
ncbi:MAG: hypothetical protein ACI4DO_00360, partial [Roseburia sp.]